MADGPTLADGKAGQARAAARIGRFDVVRKLGEGGMGVVYEGHDRQLDRKVALKLVRVVEGDVQGRARLMREAQAMAKVAHPNVVPIYEVGDHDGQVFVAMELVAGETLSGWLRREPRGWRDTLAMYVAAGRGLAAAHAVNIVHRDFKPDNVLVGHDGRPRVLDFGLARAVGSAAPEDGERGPTSVLGMELTMVGSMMGTPGYMSPEHYRGEDIGPAADQFGFAVAVYRALFGEMPFAGQTIPELRDAVSSGSIKQPRADPELPRAVVDAILRGLASDPAARFPSLEVLLEELERPLRVDPDRDLSRARTGRRIAAVVIAVGASCGIAVWAITGIQITPKWLALQAGVALTVVIAVGILNRRSLTASAHNRRVGALIASTIGMIAIHRLIALYLGAPGLDTLVGDGLMVALATTLAGAMLERWMLYGTVLAFAYVGFAIALPEDAAVGFGTLVLVYAAASARRWGRV